MTLNIDPGQVTLTDWARLYRDAQTVTLHPSAKAKCEQAHEIVLSAARGAQSVYGINTGFGKLANVRIDAADTAQLQRNLILSHASGVGPPMPHSIVRLMMGLKMNSLARGASGVSWDLIALLRDMINADVMPMIPSQGSVGASGDLAPLAHMGAVMIGEGEAFYQGERMAAGQALQNAGLKPVVLGPKDGLGLINGTQFSTAYALTGLFEARRLAASVLVTGALSTDAAMGSDGPFHPFIHDIRGHIGQIRAGEILRDLFVGSEIRHSHLDNDDRVQDPYCLRCQPQVMGACLDTLRSVSETLTIEANAVSDNPLIDISSGAIISGGNFHAEPVGMANDHLAIAIAEMGSIAQRRISTLVDPALSHGLPAFLSPSPGLNSGFMIAEVTSAALMSENKHLANPTVTDSTPTSANQEDHVSMAAHGARRLLPMCDNLRHIIAIEWMCAAQGVELRAPLTTSPRLTKAIAELRTLIPALADDRYMADDIAAASAMIGEGVLSALVADNILEGL